ncbi:MAG TPA: GxxExxY protein [Tepidisphaeraceae bacterium]|nr:GxxExxY protein [Tepidisphaeraceae bacterium]
MLLEERLTEKIISAAIEVHKQFGPGLLESAYEQAFCHELTLRGIPFRCQVDLPLMYKGARLDCGYRIDVIVAEAVVVELKSIEKVLPIHEAQLLTYMRLSGHRVGLLINFNVPLLREGIVRRVL